MYQSQASGTMLFGLLASWAVFLGIQEVRAEPAEKLENRQSTAESLAPMLYDILPLGTIKPAGWMKDQMTLESNGLGGNMFNFYRFVHDSSWLGGESEYSTYNEASPYWYNAMVPLAYSMQDDTLIAQANQYLEYVLDHQASDGWLGPETTTETRGIWARCLLLQGMMNHAIADPTKLDRIVTAMLNFTTLANKMLQNNYQGLIPKGDEVYDPGNFLVNRAFELSTALQWLYETHPNGQEDTIWSAMNLMYKGQASIGQDWGSYFVPGKFPTTARIYGDTDTRDHGVNLAEGLRWAPQLYRMNKDEKLIQQTRDSVNMTLTYFGAISGTIIADEFLAGLSPERGSETCMAVEMMFSLSYLYRFIGDNSFADRAELTAFNSFPSHISADWWSHQYVEQANQPYAHNLSSDPWFDVNTYSNVYGLEPNYPCCTVNHPTAYPKFLMSAYVLAEKGKSLIHQFLIPSSVTTTVNQSPVTVSCDTKYPFGNVLKYTITSTSAFTFYVRVPSWATDDSTYTPPSGESIPLTPNDASLFPVNIKSGKTTFTIRLGQEVRLVERANNTVAIYRGALLYALELDYTTTSIPPLAYNTLLPLDPSTTSPGHTFDNYYLASDSSHWNITIDPDQIKVYDSSDTTDDLKNPIFDKSAPPVYMNVAASLVSNWEETIGTPDVPPSEPVLEGEPFVVRLVPYGSAKVRMGELPRVRLGEVEGL